MGLMRESDPRFATLERRVGLFLLASALIVVGAVARRRRAPGAVHAEDRR